MTPRAAAAMYTRARARDMKNKTDVEHVHCRSKAVYEFIISSSQCHSFGMMVSVRADGWSAKPHVVDSLGVRGMANDKCCITCTGILVYDAVRYCLVRKRTIATPTFRLTPHIQRFAPKPHKELQNIE